MIDTKLFSEYLEENRTQELKRVIDSIGVEACDNYNRTALILAAFYNNTELVIWLIEKGVNINHQDKSGFSALHYAAKEQHVEIVKVLIESKATVDIKDSSGNTPLIGAIYNARGYYKVIELLIKAGASPELKNNFGVSARSLSALIPGFDYHFPKN
jgi:uncharacterized protein